MRYFWIIEQIQAQQNNTTIPHTYEYSRTPDQPTNISRSIL